MLLGPQIRDTQGLTSVNSFRSWVVAGQLCKKLTIGSKSSWGRVLSRVRSYGKGLEGIAKAMRCVPPLFAIAYLTARMRDDLIDPSEVELILHESGWVN